MTVTVETNRATFAGNDVTTAFPFAFKTYDATDIVCAKYSSTLVETLLVKDVDFSVVLSADGTGTVTYPISGDALAAGETLLVRRVVPNTQQVNLAPNGPYDPGSTMRGMDENAFKAIQNAEEIGRVTKRLPPNETAASDLPPADQRKGLFDGYDAGTGAPTLVAGTGSATDAAVITYDPLVTGSVSRSVKDRLDDVVDARDFGAAGDARLLEDPATTTGGTLGTTSSSGVITSTIDQFLSSDVGKKLVVQDGAAPSGGGTASTVLIGIITTFTSEQSVTIDVNAGVTVSNKFGYVGTDDRVALDLFSTFMAANPNSRGRAEGGFLIGGHPDDTEHVWFVLGDDAGYDFSRASFFGNVTVGNAGVANKPRRLTIRGGAYHAIGDDNKDATTGSVNWNGLNCIHGENIILLPDIVRVLGGGARACSIQTSTTEANVAGVPNIQDLNGYIPFKGPKLAAERAKTSGIDVVSASRDGLIDGVDIGFFGRDIGELFNANTGSVIFVNTGLRVRGRADSVNAVGARFLGFDDVDADITIDHFSGDGASVPNGRAFQVTACQGVLKARVRGSDVVSLSIAFNMVDNASNGERFKLIDPECSVEGGAGATNKWATGLKASMSELIVRNPEFNDCTKAIDNSGFSNLIDTPIFRNCTEQSDAPEQALSAMLQGVIFEDGAAAVSYYGQLGCVAWVTFDGNGANGDRSANIKSSHNVDTLTKNATGDWTITLTESAHGADMSVVGSALAEGGVRRNFGLGVAPGVTGARVVTTIAGTDTLADSDYVSAAFFAVI